jgi:hypothetical protein
MFSYDCMRILLMMLDCAVVHSTATWVSNSLKGHPLVCNLGLQSFKGTYLATVLQSWFIGVRFFKAEICPGSHSLRGYQWSLKDSGVRVGARIARGIQYSTIWYLGVFESGELNHQSWYVLISEYYHCPWEFCAYLILRQTHLKLDSQVFFVCGIPFLQPKRLIDGT